MANSFGTQNTISFVHRHKYFKSTLEVALRNALVAEKICNVDRSELKTIQNPYLTQQTAAIQAVAGTYSVSAMTTTEDSLTVADEVIFGTHVFDFETLTTNFNLMTSFFDDLTYSVSFKVDQFVLNVLTEDATGAYTTPSGGFTQAANIPVICSNLLSKVAGYQSGTATGLFLVIENTDVVGFAQAQVASGFSYADAALNNGFMSSYMGIDIYVVRSGTFVSSTLGTRSDITNSGHRLFGVKGIATYATPRGLRYEEKGVAGKTGKEIVVSCLVGAKVWTPKSDLLIDITLA
jgi:hypothetical protein